jgi:hypothetical protein
LGEGAVIAGVTRLQRAHPTRHAGVAGINRREHSQSICLIVHQGFEGRIRYLSVDSHRLVTGEKSRKRQMCGDPAHGPSNIHELAAVFAQREGGQQ